MFFFAAAHFEFLQLPLLQSPSAAQSSSMFFFCRGAFRVLAIATRTVTVCITSFVDVLFCTAECFITRRSSLTFLLIKPRSTIADHFLFYTSCRGAFRLLAIATLTVPVCSTIFVDVLFCRGAFRLLAIATLTVPVCSTIFVDVLFCCGTGLIGTGCVVAIL